MSYTKNTWVRGDKVTSAKLNNIENGILENSQGLTVLNGKIEELNNIENGIEELDNKTKVVEKGRNIPLVQGLYLKKGMIIKAYTTDANYRSRLYQVDSSGVFFIDNGTYQSYYDAVIAVNNEYLEVVRDCLIDYVEEREGDYTTSLYIVQDDKVLTSQEMYDVLKKDIAVPYNDYGLPVLKVYGDIDAMSKNKKVTMSYEYKGMSGTCTMKWQGSTSIGFPKKNFTIVFDNAFEAAEGWGAQNKYCLKANYIDCTHSRNVVSAKLWGDIVKSRTSTNEITTKLKTLVNGGAIDGFPIILVINDEYQGLYTWNIPKDRWMLGMGSGSQEAILCAKESALGACSFDKEASLNGDFDLEYVTNEDNTSWVNESLNRLINACINSDGTDLDTTIAQYLDWDSAIDYMIFCLATMNYDGLLKNYILGTYDGVKWFFSAYDLDSVYGLEVTGSKIFSPYYNVHMDSLYHRVFNLIKTYKQEELKARYMELLNSNTLSADNIIQKFNGFVSQIPNTVYVSDQSKWPTIPSTSINTLAMLFKWYETRFNIIDYAIKNIS